MAEMANKHGKGSFLKATILTYLAKTSKCMDLLTYRLLICMTWQMKYVQEVDNMPIR